MDYQLDDTTPSYELVETIFGAAVKAGSSDIHLQTDSVPYTRINGSINPIASLKNVIITKTMMDNIRDETLGPAGSARFDSDGYQHDYAFSLHDVGRFRINIFRETTGTGMVARLLPSEPKTLKQLGVSDIVANLINYRAGLVVVSGSTGSGKSSTMSGLIDLINETKNLRIVSVEAPIEILHNNKKSLISQREVGLDVDSWERAVESSLRQDPDVILIGEIRNLATLRAVLEAAETGHLVFSTIHTNDTSETLTRMLSMYPEDERDLVRKLLATTLRGVVSQRLIPHIDGRGRVVTNEVLLNTPDVYDLILDTQASSKHFREVLETKREDGMISFERHLAELVKAKKITYEVAKAASLHDDELDEFLDTAENNPSSEKKATQAPPVPSRSSAPKSPPKPPSGLPGAVQRKVLPTPAKQRTIPQLDTEDSMIQDDGIPPLKKTPYAPSPKQREIPNKLASLMEKGDFDM